MTRDPRGCDLVNTTQVMYNRIADRDWSFPHSSSATGDHPSLPEVHRKGVGADNSPALFLENDTNGSTLRSVDDVCARLCGSYGVRHHV